MPRPGATIVSPKLNDHLVDAGHYPSTGRIDRVHEASRSPSGAEITGSTPVFQVRCRLAEAGALRSSGEIRMADGTVVVATHMIDIAGTYDIREKDRYLHLEGPGMAEMTFLDILRVEHSSEDDRTRLFVERKAK